MAIYFFEDYKACQTVTELKKNSRFLQVIKKIRNKGKKHLVSLAEITKEVESVRSKRYAKSKG